MTTLGDICDRFLIYAVCIACKRSVTLPLDTLVTLYGERATVAEIRSRVRCTRCGRRTRDLRLVYVGPEGRAADFQYRR